MLGMNFFGHLGIPFVVLLIARSSRSGGAPSRRALMSVVLVGALLASGCTRTRCLLRQGRLHGGVHDPTDKSALRIPDVGANKDNQAQSTSEAFLNANRVALKRFIVPHAQLPGSGLILRLLVPAGRLIIVDRTPFSREWVDAADRGTSSARRAFLPEQGRPEHRRRRLDRHLGGGGERGEIPLPLRRHGAGRRPRAIRRTIFTSVYYSRKLADVMDDVGRKKVQTWLQ